MKDRYIPRIGQRIIKTTAAVLICLLVYYIIGYRAGEIPTEACITAIICMQPFAKDTREYAFNRFVGTIVGSIWGLLLLVLLSRHPALSRHFSVLCLLMAAGTMLSIYTTVLLGRNDSSSLAAIVFLCIVISFPDISSPIEQALLRLADVFLGTFVAIAVNAFRLPRRKTDCYVFFINTDDLIPNRFTGMAPPVQFRLNRLNADGARISLVSQHAPAFFSLQLSSLKMNAPMIVMDGAAIYSADDNSYLWKRSIEEAVLLRRTLEELGLSHFIYTIHNDRTCIFHSGEMRDAERKIFGIMKKSPYRDYLDGDVPDTSEIVCIKVIAEDGRIDEIERDLHRALPERPFRIIRRAQDEEGISALYIYDHLATVGHAKTELIKLMEQPGKELEAVDMSLKKGYHSELDAIHLLARAEQKYEPVRLFGKR